jgi:hypothetical protein
LSKNPCLRQKAQSSKINWFIPPLSALGAEALAKAAHHQPSTHPPSTAQGLPPRPTNTDAQNPTPNPRFVKFSSTRMVEKGVIKSG